MFSTQILIQAVLTVVIGLHLVGCSETEFSGRAQTEQKPEAPKPAKVTKSEGSGDSGDFETPFDDNGISKDLGGGQDDNFDDFDDFESPDFDDVDDFNDFDSGVSGVDLDITVPDNATTKGSFTVWTEPADPAPYQPYSIVVQVRLPSGLTSYTERDLYGEIKGTEGWFYFELGSDQFRPSEFSWTGNQAQLRTWIPGDDAVEGYGDIITVGSDLLNETQSISVSF